MSSMRTYLVTGASRGIGFGLVQHILRQPDTRVIATCRSPDTTSVFDELIQEYQERLVIMMLDVTSEWSFEVLKGQLVEKSITSIDVLIANAGVTGERDSFHECQQDNFNEVFNTNVFGPMLTFQNLSPLVLSSAARLFVTISSAMGSITKTEEGYPQRTGSYAVPKICASYRLSKCSSNMLSVILSRDPEIQAAECKVLCINPGWVQTDMGGAGGRTATYSVDECATNLVDILDRTIAIQSHATSGPGLTTTSDSGGDSGSGGGSGVPNENKALASSTGSDPPPPPPAAGSGSGTETEAGDRKKKEFETVLQAGSNCVFVNYDGSVIPW